MKDLNFKKIELEDKIVFDKYFKWFQPEISEYTFTNLYCWQNSRHIEFCEYNDGLIILAVKKDKKYFMPPVGYEDDNEIFEFLLNYGIKKGISNIIKNVGENQVKTLSENIFNIEEDRDNHDYVYRTGDLAFLKGRKYSNKRGFIKKFTAEYYHKYYLFKNDQCKEKCLKLSEKWLETRKEINQSYLDEFDAIKEFLGNIEYFNAVGGVLCCQHDIAGFTFGEELNDETFVIHFEKADFKYSGAYQVINKLFIENEVYNNYKFVNREQDLGIPGIRKAKESYYPVKMIKKYNVTV